MTIQIAPTNENELKFILGTATLILFIIGMILLLLVSALKIYGDLE